MKIAVIGTGYVGLVSGVCLAANGHTVTCYDVNERTIDQLSTGKCHIYEPGLESLLVSCRSNINFCVLDNKTEKKIMAFDAVLVAVGTPTVDGRSDLSQVEAVAKMLGRLLRESDEYIAIIIKSTVLPGTTDTVFKNIVEQESGKVVGDFGLGMNPEFLREGCAIEDFQFPDRIVLGFEDLKTLEVLHAIYAPWQCEKVETNTRSAEMMKYVNNALLATLISTINEYSNIARMVGKIDFKQVMHGVHLDNRWSPLGVTGAKVWPKVIDYLKPGCGYGGSCFPKDVMAISSLAQDIGVEAPILSSVIDVNERQPLIMLDILKKHVCDLREKEVLMLGLSFKPDTDDVRESISLKLLELLSDEVKLLSAHDPIAIANAKRELNLVSNIEFVDNWKAKVPKVDIIIIATKWIEYSDLHKMEGDIAGKIVFDMRSLLTQFDLSDLTYITVN